MIGKVQSKEYTRIGDATSHTYDVKLVLSGNQELEFRIFNMDEKMACNFATIGSEIDIELNDANRLSKLFAPHLKYTNR